MHHLFSAFNESAYYQVPPEFEKSDKHDMIKPDGCSNEVIDDNDNDIEEEPKWWEGESQNILDSQQLVEALSLCDDLLQSQSPLGTGILTTAHRGASLAFLNMQN